MGLVVRVVSTLGLVVPLIAACSGGGGDGSDPGADPSLDGGGGDDGGTTNDDGGDGGATHASGEADATFGKGGHLELSYRRNFAVADMAIQPDGKVVLAGSNTPPASAWKGGLVMRLETNGSPDASFGTNGEAMFDMGASTDGYFYGVSVAPDGKLLLAGSKTANTTAGALTDFFYMQVLSNGTANAAFGTQGRTTFDPNGSHKNTLYETVFHGDGTAAYLGVSTGSTLYRTPSVSRVTPMGQRQATYGIKGTVHTQIDNRYLHHVTFQKDGKLVFCYGNQQRGAGLFIERYSDTGTLEASGTFPIVDMNGDHSRCDAVLAEDGGKFVVAGVGFTCNTEPTCPGKSVLVRFNADLTVDGAFDTAGTSATLTADGESVGLREQPGAATTPAVALIRLGDRLRVRRFGATGAIDAAFNQNAGYKDLALTPMATYRGSGFRIEPNGRMTTWAVVETQTEAVLLLDRFWL